MPRQAPSDPPPKPAAPTLLSVVSDERPRALVREAAATAGCGACFEAATLPAALEAAARLRPDLCALEAVLVEDLSAALDQLSSSSPETRVVVLAPDSGGDGLLPALAGGAKGYLTADLAPEPLARTLEDVLAGGVSVPRGLLGRLVDQVAGQGPPRAVAER